MSILSCKTAAATGIFYSLQRMAMKAKLKLPFFVCLSFMVLQIDLFVFQHCSQQKCRVHLSTNYGIPEVALLALLSALPSSPLVISLIVIGKKLSLQSSVWRFILPSLSLFLFLFLFLFVFPLASRCAVWIPVDYISVTFGH